MNETTVRSYTSLKGYAHDRERMRGEGWQILSSQELKPRLSDLRRSLLRTIWRQVFPPRPRFIVAYTREEQ
jgi:hypothetical protein